MSDLMFYSLMTASSLLMSFLTFYFISIELCVDSRVLIAWNILTVASSVLAGKAYLIQKIGGSLDGNGI